MKKILVGLFLSIFFILSGGGINYHFSLPVKPLDVFLLVVGIVILLVTIVAAIIIFLRQRSQRSRQDYLYLSLAITLFGAGDACAAGIHDVLIPPDKWPMAQWNPNAMSGSETWVIILAIVGVGLAWLVVQKFLRGCFQ